jgi:Icc-related predicted phosphoesterase
MRVVCISDTHDIDYPILPEGDLLIHAGDVSLDGSPQEVQRFLDWFGEQPHKRKIFVGGNHDLSLCNYTLNYFNVHPTITYLLNSWIEVEGFKIWGSPSSRTYGHIDAFMHDEGRLAYLWESIPDNADIVITHSPAQGILDSERDGIPLGSESLHRRLVQVEPKLHVCGHIHGGYGVKEIDNTIFVNASHLDVTYRKFREAIVVDITPGQ